VKHNHYKFRGVTSPVLCRQSQCRKRLPGSCQRLCHLLQCCGSCGKPLFAGKVYSANRQRIRNARGCRTLPATGLPYFADGHCRQKHWQKGCRMRPFLSTTCPPPSTGPHTSCSCQPSCSTQLALQSPCLISMV